MCIESSDISASFTMGLSPTMYSYRDSVLQNLCCFFKPLIMQFEIMQVFSTFRWTKIRSKANKYVTDYDYIGLNIDSSGS